MARVWYLLIGPIHVEDAPLTYREPLINPSFEKLERVYKSYKLEDWVTDLHAWDPVGERVIKLNVEMRPPAHYIPRAKKAVPLSVQEVAVDSIKQWLKRRIEERIQAPVPVRMHSLSKPVRPFNAKHSIHVSKLGVVKTDRKPTYLLSYRPIDPVARNPSQSFQSK